MSERLSDVELRELAAMEDKLCTEPCNACEEVRLARELIESRQQLAQYRAVTSTLTSDLKRLDNVLRWIAAVAFRRIRVSHRWTTLSQIEGEALRQLLTAAGYTPSRILGVLADVA